MIVKLVVLVVPVMMLVWVFIMAVLLYCFKVMLVRVNMVSVEA